MENRISKLLSTQSNKHAKILIGPDKCNHLQVYSVSLSHKISFIIFGWRKRINDSHFLRLYPKDVVSAAAYQESRVLYPGVIKSGLLV